MAKGKRITSGVQTWGGQDVLRVTVSTVLPERLAVVAGQQDHARIQQSRVVELGSHPPERIVDPTDCREIGALVVAPIALELARGGVLVNVHEVQIEKERALAIVGVHQAKCLLEHTIGVGPH